MLFDLETSPNVGYTWGSWEQNVIKIIQHRQIISIAWKWFGEKETHSLALCDFPGYKKDRKNNRALVLELHRLISKSSIAIGHNIDRFDDKRANTDFLKHNLPPPPPHKTIDTLKVAKKYFDFNSNRLDSLGEFLGVGRKVKHSGFEMWERCLAGDQDAWDSMKKYNAQDVALLERVYLKLRPWMQGHPDLNAPDGHIGCPACRGVNLERRGSGCNAHGTYSRFQCRDCHKWSKGKIIREQMHYR